MTIDDLHEIENTLAVFLPGYYKAAMLRYPFSGGHHHPVIRDSLLNDKQQIISLNLRLRRNGFKRKSWPPKYLIIGTVGSGNYFLDTDSPQDQSVYVVFENRKYQPSRLREHHLFQSSFQDYLEFWRVMSENVNNS